MAKKQGLLKILLIAAAYSYEELSESIIDDAMFDKLSKLVNKTSNTGLDYIDKFFTKEFEPDTGMWIKKVDLPTINFCCDAIKEFTVARVLATILL